ncbi:MAG TPA: peptidylprolyl isomerase [Devosia sp.]|jgi:peptidyl-prolyl cis-trans isomerase C|nr:peptidylprolyl isomerase [Reyranella sp.]HWV00371.1 peptidylprolyl isomerase [Devosia sp.]
MTSHISPARLPGFLKFIVLALVALTLAALPFSVNAQDTSSSAPAAASSAEPAVPPAPSPNTVVATVGGQQITEADLAFAAEDLGQDLQQIPQDQIRAVLLTQMIDLKLMAEAGHAANLEQSDLYKERLSYLQDRALRRAFTKQAVSDAITSDAIKAEYDKQIAAMPSVDEVHARHILVSTEDDAKAIKAQLDGGADFATLAKQKSIEPGAKDSGGDLGYFTQDKMVKPFADAAFALKVGQISDPIQTQFGWHIIQVLDRRPAAKPTLQDMTQQIGQALYVAKYRALFDDLRSKATIDIPDAQLKAQVDAQLAPQQPPAQPDQAAPSSAPAQ